MLALGADSRRKSKAFQWVVAMRPSNNPAFPRRQEPVQTDAVNGVSDACLEIQRTSFAFPTSLRVPLPPGTTNKSNFTLWSKVISGVKRKPPVAKIGFRFSEINKTLKGEGSLKRRS